MATFDTLDEFDPDARQDVEALLMSGEEFVMAVRSTGLFSWMFPYFIVTNKRFIQWRKIWWSEYFSDVDLSRVARVEYGTQAFGKSSELELEGAGLDETFTFTSDAGRELATALRAQLADQKQPA